MEHTSALVTDAYSALRNADWSFLDELRREELHPYPARYVRALPRQVIDLVGVQRGAVLDPFCGSGTTLYEARAAGLSAIGSDINPIAVLISRVRVANPSDAQLATASSIGRTVQDTAAAFVVSDNARVQSIPRVEHWFSPGAMRAMEAAVQVVSQIDDAVVREIVSAGISAATVRISNQESDTRYAAVSKRRSQDDCALLLGRSIERVVGWVRENKIETQGFADVRMSDARDLSWVEPESVGLACFSPPYPNAYEYWLYHKYRMYWLGFDPVAVRGVEIGARPHYSKQNGLTAEDFYEQMRNVYEELSRVMQSGAHAVCVVGDSIIRGESVDNGELIAMAAEQAGMRVYPTLARTIAEKRSSFNRSHARGRKQEHIVVAVNK